jgi:hypothetical protein
MTDINADLVGGDVGDRLDAMLRKHVGRAVSEGVAIGLQAAIDALKGGQPHTAAENQTWDSAMAFLAVLKAQHSKRLTALQEPGQ